MKTPIKFPVENGYVTIERDSSCSTTHYDWFMSGKNHVVICESMKSFRTAKEALTCARRAFPVAKTAVQVTLVEEKVNIKPIYIAAYTFAFVLLTMLTFTPHVF